MSLSLHRYVSTACQHERHEGCRVVCKFCNQLCLCRCHWDGSATQHAQAVYDIEMARRRPDGEGMSGLVTPGVQAEALPLADGSVQTTVTSPPYWGQRDYGYPGQSGLEECYVDYLAWWAEVMTEIRRVTAPSGTCWFVVGDTYNTRTQIRPSAHQPGSGYPETGLQPWGSWRDRGLVRYSARQPGLKDKDLMGMPWRMAQVAIDVGWWLRCDVIWSKPYGLSENAPDRPARSHEYVFLLARSQQKVKSARTPYMTTNRSVWSIPPRSDRSGPAAFPEKLVRICLEGTSDPGDLVLDPFAGSGTTIRVANDMGRRGVGFDAAPADLVQVWGHLAPDNDGAVA